MSATIAVDGSVLTVDARSLPRNQRRVECNRIQRGTRCTSATLCGYVVSMMDEEWLVACAHTNIESISPCQRLLGSSMMHRIKPAQIFRDSHESSEIGRLTCDCRPTWGYRKLCCAGQSFSHSYTSTRVRGT
jgi:hypothetical protein